LDSFADIKHVLEVAVNRLEPVMREHLRQSAKDICNALLDYAVKQDEVLRENGDEALVGRQSSFHHQAHKAQRAPATAGHRIIC
jgi:hypothetical protein